ncbi:MAG: ATP-binding cassette domain-containing protein, partial [Oscillospiraceae bacterium]
GFSIATILLRMKFSLAQMEEGVKVSGTTFALFSGIQKVKLSGAEHRAFSRWTTQYLKWAKYSYAPPTFLKLNTVIQMAITGVGTLVLYAAAIQSQVSVSNYMAFTSSYGMVSAAFAAFSGIALSIANIKPIMEMVNPILKTVPEISENKKVVTRLMGGIELNNVSFRYQKTMPLILDNISLKIRSGQYVAIVGKTGCGKSTLMRLLLGFEQPQKGSVYYDGKDMNTMDLKSLRQNMGVVMQNGKLFSGDVFSNIVISAPQSTLADAWKAAEMAGIAEDIRNMPMGMNTFISEGSGGISGGQRQRIMIARAVAPKPKILLLDEATSALDNITQKIVSDSLMGLKCTRIVIAHRLSTIKDADLILVMKDGDIIEQGSHEDLLAQNGFYAELYNSQFEDAA